MGEILELLAEFESIDVDLDVSGLRLRLSFTQSNVEFFFSLQSTYKSLYCFDERHYHPKVGAAQRISELPEPMLSSGRLVFSTMSHC
jgi:L-rhamnose isomerase